MAGDAREVVIVGVATLYLAALGLYGDDGLAAPDRREMECAVADLRIVLRCGPGVLQILLQGGGKLGQRITIISNAPRQFRVAQRLSEPIDGFDVKARRAEIAQQRFGRRQRVESHGMRNLMRTAGVAGEDHGKHACRTRASSQADATRKPG